MDEESQRRVILSCSLTLTSEISSSRRPITRALAATRDGERGAHLGFWLGRDGTEAGWGDLGLWWLLSKQLKIELLEVMEEFLINPEEANLEFDARLKRGGCVKRKEKKGGKAQNGS